MVEIRICRNLFSTDPKRRWCIDATPKSQARAIYTGYGHTFKEALANFKNNGRMSGHRT